MEDPVIIICLVIVVLAIAYALFQLGTHIVNAVKELKEIEQSDWKLLLYNWTWEKKLAWSLVVLNSTISYFINEIALIVLFFHLMWIAVINTVFDFYLEHIQITPSDRVSNDDVVIRTKRQKERIIFLVIIFIFGIEFFTLTLYKHSIVNVLRMVIGSVDNRVDVSSDY